MRPTSKAQETGHFTTRSLTCPTGKTTHMLAVQGFQGCGFSTTRKLALRQLGEARGWMGYAFLAEQKAAGITPSTIFSAPGFQVKHLMVD